MLRGRSLHLAQVLLTVAPAFITYGYNQAGVAPLASLQSWYLMLKKPSGIRPVVDHLQGSYIPGDRYDQHRRRNQVTKRDEERCRHRGSPTRGTGRVALMHLFW